MSDKERTYGQGQRSFIMVATLCVAVMLWWAAWDASSSWHALQAAQQELKHARQRSQSFEQLRIVFAKYQSWQQQKQTLQDRIVRADFLETNWNVRSLSIENAELPRQQIQAYLTSMANKKGYFFAPSAFNLHALQPGGDIFFWRDGSGDRLGLTVKGEYFMRRQQP
ncbi:MAG: hypothetical protein M0O96_10145 [Desulforhopalus sp.]|nr:hypothetical protein [Desulforhopalus sp.]